MRQYSILIVLLIGTLLIPLVATEEQALDVSEKELSHLEQLFEEMVLRQDPSLEISRDLLLAEGESLLPLLEEQQRSSDWRRQLAAEALLLRLRYPEQTQRWEEAIIHHYSNHLPVDISTPQQVVLGDVSLDRRATPLLVEHLWLTRRPLGAGLGRHHIPVILAMLAHLGDERAARPMLLATIHEIKWREDLLRAMVALGQPAVSRISEGLIKDMEQVDQGFLQQLQIRVAIRSLGQIGDRAVIETLLTILQESTSGEVAGEAGQALAILGAADRAAESAAVQLIRLLESSNRGIRQTSDWQYSLRELLQALRMMSPKSAVAIAHQAQGVEDLKWLFLLSGLRLELADAALLAEYEEQVQQQGVRLPINLPVWGAAHDRETWVPEGRLRPVGLGRLMIRAALQENFRYRPCRTLFQIGQEQAPGALGFILAHLPQAVAPASEALAALQDPAAIAPLAAILEENRFERQAVLRALFSIGGPQAARVLHSWAQRPVDLGCRDSLQEQALSRAFALALDDRVDELEAYLDGEHEMRYAAAEALLSINNQRGVVVVLEQIAGLTQGAEDWGKRIQQQRKYLRLQGLLLDMGEDVLPILRQATSKENPLPFRIAAEAAMVWIKHPELCRSIEEALTEANCLASRKKIVLATEVYAAGRGLAEQPPIEAIAYIESFVVFGLPLADIAAGTLAAMGQERSIAAIVYGVTNGLSREIAALALKDFGEAGLAASRTLPLAQPQD